MSVKPHEPADVSKPDAPEEEAPLGAPQHVRTSLDPRHILFVIFVNVLVLAELCVAMYMATQQPDEFTPVFFKTFFTLLVPTLVLAVVGKRFVPKAKQ